MASRRQVLGPRSSLLSHVFPPFYACYLLKSVQTPRSKATYVGSTPSPPRRIRQHNGELKQGAWKTRLRRPWVMQMIVHGFPSRLAALQFEWAWQHPDKSRHLRDTNGEALFVNRTPKHVKMNVRIVRTMIANHPYQNWPLHVKLFTDEAVMAWKDATRDVAQFPMPPGFTCSVELEGVDGKSGQVGSGRSGPIGVKDEQFTFSYLAKNTALLASNRPLKCSVCQGLLTTYTTDALSTVLCPAPSCTTVSHLSCLSKQFLDSDPSETALVPRGGTCTSCNTYTLWGDIVRGCYRRMVGGIISEEDDIPETDQGELYESDGVHFPAEKTTKRQAKSPTAKTRKPQQKKLKTAASSSEGELFDLDVSSTDELPDTPRKRGRSPKAPTSPATKRSRPQKNPLRVGASDSSKRALLDLNPSTMDQFPDPPRRRGRPRQVSLSPPPILGTTIPKPTSSSSTKQKSSRPRKSTSSEGELFYSDVSSADNTPRKRGRPQKAPPTIFPPAVSLRTMGRTGAPSELPLIPRKRGRPPKGSPTPIAEQSVPRLMRKTVRVTPGRRKLGKKHHSTAAGQLVAFDSSGEFFDFATINHVSSEDDMPLIPRIGKTPVGTPRRERVGSFKASRPRRQPGLVAFRHEELDDRERTDIDDRLVRVMSSMSVSSPAASPEPRYIELSD